MPISDSKYQAPTWINGEAPAIDATELQAMSDTIQKNQNESSGNYNVPENLNVDGTTTLNGTVTTNAGLDVAGTITQGGKAVGLKENVETAQATADSAASTAATAQEQALEAISAATLKLPLTGGSITGNLSVSGAFRLSGGVVSDYIVAQGTSGNWQYWKYNSGLAICVHTDIYGNSGTNRNFNYNQDSATWGDWYDLPEYTFSAYPFTFVDVPAVYASRTAADDTSYNSKLVFVAMSGGTTTNPPVFDIARPNYILIGGPKLRIVAIGRWK